MIQKLKDNWAALSFIGVLLSAGGYGAVRAQAALDQVAANTNWIAQQNYFRLDNLRVRNGLTHRQWLQWCSFGIKAGIMKSCPRFIPNVQTGRAK